MMTEKEATQILESAEANLRFGICADCDNKFKYREYLSDLLIAQKLIARSEAIKECIQVVNSLIPKIDEDTPEWRTLVLATVIEKLQSLNQKRKANLPEYDDGDDGMTYAEHLDEIKRD